MFGRNGNWCVVVAADREHSKASLPPKTSAVGSEEQDAYEQSCGLVVAFVLHNSTLVKRYRLCIDSLGFVFCDGSDALDSTPVADVSLSYATSHYRLFTYGNDRLRVQSQAVQRVVYF